LRKLADESESPDGIRDPRPCLIPVDGKPGQLLEGPRVQHDLTRCRHGDLGRQQLDVDAGVVEDSEGFQRPDGVAR
jgi:hypothetical protein